MRNYQYIHEFIPKMYNGVESKQTLKELKLDYIIIVKQAYLNAKLMQYKITKSKNRTFECGNGCCGIVVGLCFTVQSNTFNRKKKSYLKTIIKRLTRKTICYSKTEYMHDIVIG